MRMSVHKRAMTRVVWAGMAALAILTATGALARPRNIPSRLTI
jgi:hypothetical protein